MTANTEILIIAAAALVALSLIGFGVVVWRGIRARRELKHALRESETALSEARLAQHGGAVELQQLRVQLQDKQAEVGALRGEIAALRDRLQDVLQTNAELETTRRERDGQHREQLTLLNEARDSLKKDFENLANRIFEDKGRHFTNTSRASLEAMLQPFREQISGFQQRINEVHTQSVKGNAALEAEIRKVLEVGLEMNTQASNLSSALKGDKKTTGNWGEAQLERTLELAGLLPGEHYETQAAFRDEQGKRRVPDFVIKLPDGKSLVVDSKVSLVDYDRAIAAQTDEHRAEALNAHAQAVRAHIDDLNVKDYANLPGMGSPDFVLMFMPVEPAYIEAMKHNRDLFNYGYQKGVVMVSHTTLMPILRTVANLWMVDRSNREAREISSRAGDIYNQVCRVAERLEKLGNSMRAAQSHYNDTVTSLVGKQGLHGKVERFQQVSAKANKTMPALEPIHENLEAGRLDSLTGDENSQSGEETDAETTESAKVKHLRAEKKDS